jgi:DNA-binding CsgD family transcriptional regulator
MCKESILRGVNYSVRANNEEKMKIPQEKMPLGKEEKQILNLLKEGKSVEEICKILKITENRFWEYFGSIQIKIGRRNASRYFREI